MAPEHEGQDSGDPFRSLAMRFRACAGLYEAGRGLRMDSPEENQRAVISPARIVDHHRKVIRSSQNPKWLAAIDFNPLQAEALESAFATLRGPIRGRSLHRRPRPQ